MGDVLNYGRAAVDALGHRLAGATSPENIMAEIGKTNAEIMRAVRDLQEEVVERAQHGTTSSSPGLPLLLGAPSTTQAGVLQRPASQQQLQQLRQQQQEALAALIDNLRADVAATRAIVQRIKLEGATGLGEGRR
ncbi:hypothetical protein N2152v2_009052 [Parachlorella kessleri]